MTTHPNDQGIPASATPSYLVVNGQPVSALNPLPASTQSGGAQLVNAVNNYLVTTAFTGANVNDILQNIKSLDVSQNPPAILANVWLNLTQGTVLASAPNPANIVLQTSNALTNSELRASPVASSSAQLPTTIGPKASAASLSIAMATDATMPLPTGGSTANNQVLGNTSLASIDGKLPAIGPQPPAQSLSVTIAEDGYVYPTITLFTGPGSIPAGAQSLALYNSGTAPATFDGGVLPAGFGVEYICNAGSLIGAVNFDATGTELYVTRLA